MNLFPFLSGNLHLFAASNEGEQRIIFNRNCPLDIHSLFNLNWPGVFTHLWVANCIHFKQAKMVNKEFSLADICRSAELDKSAGIGAQFFAAFKCYKRARLPIDLLSFP